MSYRTCKICNRKLSDYYFRQLKDMFPWFTESLICDECLDKMDFIERCEQISRLVDITNHL